MDWLIDAVCDLRASIRDEEWDDAASHALGIEHIAHDLDTKAMALNAVHSDGRGSSDEENTA